MTPPGLVRSHDPRAAHPGADGHARGVAEDRAAPIKAALQVTSIACALMAMTYRYAPDIAVVAFPEFCAIHHVLEIPPGSGVEVVDDPDERAADRRRERWDPMNPTPPVISA